MEDKECASKSVVHTFDDLALAVSLAGLDEVRSRGVELQAVRLVSVGRLAHQDVLQRDDASRLLVRRVLKVVEAVVVQDEPASLPTLVSAACAAT